MEDSKNLRQIGHVMTQEEYNNTPHPIADQFRKFGIPLDVPESLPISLNNIHNNMNGMMDFIFENTTNIHVIVNGPTPDCTLFCGPDIARVLGYTHVPDVYRMLADYEKVVINISSVHNMHRTSDSSTHNSSGTSSNISDSSSGISTGMSPLGGNPNVVFITLPGLFRVISRSRHPKAMEFQNWVYHVVLPSIWSCGAYMAPETRNQLIQNPSLIYDLTNKVINCEKQISELKNQNNILNNQILDMAPYASTGKFMVNNMGSIPIESLAKMLNSSGVDIGRNRLFRLLRNEGFLMKTGTDNRPTQKSLDLGLMVFNSSILSNGNTCTLVFITPKGINYFINKYKDLK